MDMKQAFVTCMKKYADFSGRASRPEYWWFFLCYLLITAAASILGRGAWAVAVLALLLPSIAAGARRLHDIGRSGWWLLVGMVPMVGGLVLLYWAVQPSESGANAYGAESA